MDEYVNRKKLEEAFDNADTDVCESDMDGHSDWGFGRENVRDVIRSVPAADVAPVVHGRWIHYPDCGVTRCSHCGWSIEECWESKRCPDCGAKMNKEDEDDDGMY